MTESIKEYYLADRSEFAAFLEPYGPFAWSLDIGCAGGRLGGELMHNGAVISCDGIEPHPAAADIARKTLSSVWVGSLESVVNEVPWSKYDLVIMADVLEHLFDPWAALRLLHKKTSPGCRLALSVPNIRYYKVLLPLLFRGEFKYQDEGIMDRTHLHFFTRESLNESLEDNGWTMCGIHAHTRSRYRRFPYPARRIEPFVAVRYLLIAEKK